MKKILLTGATGFVGKNILEAFRDRYIIDAPSRSELNLTDPEAVGKYIRSRSYNFIIHAANPSPLRSNDSADRMLDDTLMQFYGIVREKGRFEKLIYFGSGAEFDKSRDISQVRETDIGECMPKTQYGFAKYIMNQHVQGSDNMINLRLFGCFGPHEYWPTCFISNAICRALFDMPISIRQNVFFDYLYVDDLMNVVGWALESDLKYNDYNVCSGNRIDLITLAEMVRGISKKKIDIVVLKEGLNKEYTASNERLKSEYSGFSVTPIVAAIEMLYHWYKDRIDTIDPKKIQA